ncbi:hypothetical protein RJ55_00159 [Drechmeria coniospora]|nr:hypothetical protein RJ55_00159 [Drechmeria coniospora]
MSLPPTWCGGLLNRGPTSPVNPPTFFPKAVFHDSNRTRNHDGPVSPPFVPSPQSLPRYSSDVHADTSSEEPENHTLQPGGSWPPHTRPMSNPFPSFFSSKKKKQDSNGRDPPDVSVYDVGTMAGASSKKPTQRRPPGSKDFAMGNCMTCSSLVRWPKELKVFKCTICASINDLVPADNIIRRKASSERGSGFGRDPAATHQRGKPISTQYCKRLVRQCTHSYLTRTLGEKLGASSQTCMNPSKRPLPNNRQPRPTDAMQGHGRISAEKHIFPAFNGSACTNDSKHIVDQELPVHLNPSRSRSPLPRSYSLSYSENPGLRRETSQAASTGPRRNVSTTSDPGPKRIFKPLEEYIVACFSSLDCVNSSFMTPAPRPPGRQGIDPPIRTKPLNPRETQIPRQDAHETTRDAMQTEDLVSELDPKMLLLGDFAENGMWWTGGGGPSSAATADTATMKRVASASSTSVPSKTPQVNWRELDDWYSSVINPAEGWFAVYEEVSQLSTVATLSERDLQDLERDFLQAQEHVQRVLLKATELLLKRPGRPISDPASLRFLLIALENPLLYSEAPPFQGILQPDHGPSVPSKAVSSENASLPSSGLLSGQHSGVIKRIIGIMSNVSTECHNRMIAWFAKYPTARFTRTKELISGFLTYRMLRQSDRTLPAEVDITAGLIPEMPAGRSVGAILHAEIGSSSKRVKEPGRMIAYSDDWQIKAASRVLALLFAANNLQSVRHGDEVLSASNEVQPPAARDGVRGSGQLLPTSDFYNLMLDNADLVGDFEAWESKRAKFSFCQYPFLLSIWAKTKILEYDARRQMQNKARDAFFDSIMTRRNIQQYLNLEVRRDCLVDDSLKAVSEVIGSGSEDAKKALRITFTGEEGIDGGGLRKEWFLLLVREVFNPDHGMFMYDEDSHYCYFNPNSFETSDQFFLVGVVMGLAIYNSTILDVALPPFAFRKLLASAPAHGQGASAHPKPTMKYTLDDLSEYRPRLARGLRQLLEFDGDVEEVFSLNFVIDVDKYGTTGQVPLCPGGERMAVTAVNRREYVDLYVRYILDGAVTRQFEPFKRGFYTVCGGNAFSLFRPEEVELLIRGSDEALDIAALRAVAEYDNWGSRRPDGESPVVGWFWQTFEEANPEDQRKLLLFITGSDRIPAMGAAMLPIKLSCLGDDCGRYPIARTCFNMLSLWLYGSKERLEAMLWRAVKESEGFGLK